MAQPAVSIAVRKLEEALDTRLFDRSGRKVALTAEGINLLGRAQSILAQLETFQTGGDQLNLLESVPTEKLCWEEDQVLPPAKIDHPLLQQIRELSINEMSPIDVFNRVASWQNDLTDGEQ